MVRGREDRRGAQQHRRNCAGDAALKPAARHVPRHDPAPKLPALTNHPAAMEFQLFRRLRNGVDAFGVCEVDLCLEIFRHASVTR
jgi:hypothetical protein